MTQKARTNQGLRTAPVRGSAGQSGGKDDAQELSDTDLLTRALLQDAVGGVDERVLAAHEKLTELIRFEYRACSTTGRFPTPRVLAARLLADTELLDAIVAYRLRQNAIGVIVGEVVMAPDGGWEFDESGESMFDRISQTLHTSDSAAREELAEIRETDPEARLFALTDITEEPTE